MSNMVLWSFLPLLSFLVLLVLERKRPAQKTTLSFMPSDWILNLSGFFIQGLIIPLLGYYLSTQCFPRLLPSMHGTLAIGFWGAFFLNFIGVDLLYYLQHRIFHQIPWLWKLHAPHHHSPMVNVWVTSRNALVSHFLFVYLLLNPVLGYLCDAPDGFFVGAMLTAALDLFRHANIQFELPWLDGILMLPKNHHRHHDAKKTFAHYGANFMIWDRLFGTADTNDNYLQTYTVPQPPSFFTQLLYPWKA